MSQNWTNSILHLTDEDSEMQLKPWKKPRSEPWIIMAVLLKAQV